MHIGFEEVGIFDKRNSRSILQIDGLIKMDGYASFGQGSKICVYKDAVLKLGNYVRGTAELSVVCTNDITLSDHSLFSWNVLILDSDLHCMLNINTGEVSKPSKPIIIGENVWVGTRAIILKNSKIAKGCIIGANSVVSGSYCDPNCIIAGNPATVVKTGYTLS